MRIGATISGALHGGLILAVAIGADWVAPPPAAPLQLTEVAVIDGTAFDARVATAPVRPEEVEETPETVAGPAPDQAPDQAPEVQAGPEPAPEPEAEPEAEPEGAEAAEAAPIFDQPTDREPVVVFKPAPRSTAPEPEPAAEDSGRDDLAAAETTPEPEADPEAPVLAPAPPTPVPSEQARPSVAETPSPDPAPEEAAEPESPPSTERLQPLATRTVPVPGEKPAPPREPEAAPEPEPEPVADPEPVQDVAEAEKVEVREVPAEPEPEPEPAPVAEPEPEPEAEPEAPREAPTAAAPQQARLPLARPSDRVAASQASRQTRQPDPGQETAPDAAPEREEAPRTARRLPSRDAPETEPERAEEPARSPSRLGGATSRFAVQMSRGEKDQLALGIRRHFYYNQVPDPQLAVKVAIELDRSGRIEGNQITLLTARGGTPASQNQLFRAARRALLLAQNAGAFQRLPAQKYPVWRSIHITFTPNEIGFSS